MHTEHPPIEPSDHPQTPTPRRHGATLPLVAAAFVGLVVLVAILSGGSDRDAEGSVDWSSIRLTTTDGGSTSLADFEGTPVVVNFFASWCPPCRAELPDIEAIHNEFGDAVSVVGVNRDQTENAWKALIEESGITYTTVFEGMDGALFEATDGLNMPTTLFISADGEIVHSAVGLQTDESLRDLIDTKLLG